VTLDGRAPKPSHTDEGKGKHRTHKGAGGEQVLQQISSLSTGEKEKNARGCQGLIRLVSIYPLLHVEGLKAQVRLEKIGRTAG